MCGICGAFNFRSQLIVDRQALEAMNRQIVHRGPDDDGFYLDGNVGVAMRRLSIIDLRMGHQPISNEDNSIWIVFNGEIYNHEDLRKTLEQKGHCYRTHSDTETIIHLYEEYGRGCVKYLRGMFAFAIWDSNHRALFIARDRLGIKPLYYLHAKEFLLFASEIKALLAYPGIRAEFNRNSLPEYLAFGYLSGSETMFAGVKKLPPGYVLEADESGRIDIQQYWDVPQGEQPEHHSRNYYVQNYREMLEQSVGSHLMSDVPLGVFLSGGIDSSLVAALMTRIRKEPIETFSVGYDDQTHSELPYARMVATHLRSLHHEIKVSRQDFFTSLPKLIWHEDEPIAWPSSVPLYFVARLASERVKVVLTGEGSDETLAGYTRYVWTIWNARFGSAYRAILPASVRAYISREISDTGRLKATARRRLEHTFLGRDLASWPSLYFDNFYSAFSEVDQQNLVSDAVTSEKGTPYKHSMVFWEKSKGDLLERMLYTDIKTYLVELCMKQDQMSMAASIESRVPFLDHVLVEFAMSIPGRFKTRGLQGKLVLKEGARGLLPDTIIHRKKMGFPTPLKNWLLGPQLDLIEGMLLDARSTKRALFKPEALRRLFAEHRARYRDHGDRIWRLLNLELWQRIFVDGDAAIVEGTNVK